MFRGLRKGHQEMVRDYQSLGAELQQKVALEQRHPDRGEQQESTGHEGWQHRGRVPEE